MDKIMLMLRTYGVLRLGLLTMVVLDLIFRPIPGTPADLHGAVMTDLVVPIMSPILFMLLLLDAIMTGIYMSAKEGEEKTRYRIILWSNLLLAGFFIWYWVPYFKALNLG